MVHHGVDGVFELENFTFGVDRDLGGKIAERDGCGDLGNIAHLIGEVAGHGVHAFGEVFPCAGHIPDNRLAAQFAFSAHLARHADHLRSERTELLDHGVDNLGGAQEFAFELAAVYFGRHSLRKVAPGDGRDDARNFSGRLDQIGNETVHAVDARSPAAGVRSKRGALCDFPLFPDGPADALELPAHVLVEFENLIERVGNFAAQAYAILRHADGEISPLERGQDF